MAQNIDLIEIVSAASGGCGCSAGDFAGDFIAKTEGTFITSLSSTGGKSTWAYSGDTATFTLGTLSSTDVGTLTVQGATDADAIIYVKSNDGSSTTITPVNVSAETLTISGAATTAALTVSGNLEPSADSTDGSDGLYLGASGKRWRKVWARDLDVEGTFTVANLTLSGNLVVNGDTTLGNASGDAVTVTGTATFTQEAEFNGGINCDGTLAMESNVVSATNWGIASNGNVTTSGTVISSSETASNFQKLIVNDAPTSNKHAVRKVDVDLDTDGTFQMASVVVSGGFITGVSATTTANMLDHAESNHATTKIDGTSPASGNESDAIHPYMVGAVDREKPVVKGQLALTYNGSNGSNDNYRYPGETSAQSVPYFKVIEATANPTDESGPPNQIIFRKRT